MRLNFTEDEVGPETGEGEVNIEDWETPVGFPVAVPGPQKRRMCDEPEGPLVSTDRENPVKKPQTSERRKPTYEGRRKSK